MQITSQKNMHDSEINVIINNNIIINTNLVIINNIINTTNVVKNKLVITHNYFYTFSNKKYNLSLKYAQFNPLTISYIMESKCLNEPINVASESSTWVLSHCINFSKYNGINKYNAKLIIDQDEIYYNQIISPKVNNLYKNNIENCGINYIYYYFMLLYNSFRDIHSYTKLYYCNNRKDLYDINIIKKVILCEYNKSTNYIY